MCAVCDGNVPTRHLKHHNAITQQSGTMYHKEVIVDPGACEVHVCQAYVVQHVL